MWSVSVCLGGGVYRAAWGSGTIAPSLVPSHRFDLDFAKSYPETGQWITVVIMSVSFVIISWGWAPECGRLLNNDYIVVTVQTKFTCVVYSWIFLSRVQIQDGPWPCWGSQIPRGLGSASLAGGGHWKANEVGKSVTVCQGGKTRGEVNSSLLEGKREGERQQRPAATVAEDRAGSPSIGTAACGDSAGLEPFRCRLPPKEQAPGPGRRPGPRFRPGLLQRSYLSQNMATFPVSSF